MKQFFEEVERSLVAGVSEEELAIFFKVMHQFYENMKKRSEE
jgi:transcriptional regulator, MarR family